VASGRERSVSRRVSALFRRRPGLSPLLEDESNGTADNRTSKDKEGERKLCANMIRRTNAPPRPIDPNGQIIIDRVMPVDSVSEEAVGRKAVPRPVVVASPRQASLAGIEEPYDTVEPSVHDKDSPLDLSS